MIAVAPYFIETELNGDNFAHWTNDEEALEILKVKKNLRILKFSKDQLPKKNQNSTKSIMGGLLVQDTDDSEEKTENWISVTNKNPSNQINLDLNFAWKICKHVKSNAIVIAKDQKTIGIGAGQMNRVGAAKIALEAAGRLCTDAVLASDVDLPTPLTPIKAIE